MSLHEKNMTRDVGLTDRQRLIAEVTESILATPAGYRVVLTVSPMTDNQAKELRSWPYCSPGARSHAESVVAAGQRRAAHGEGKAPDGPPLDVLLFEMGSTQETQRLVIEAADNAIPDILAPKKETTIGDPVGALARRIERLLMHLSAANVQVEKLRAKLDAPELIDFSAAVVLEAAHQRERWDSDHDAGKTDADWFWLIGYLAGKALYNPANEMKPLDAKLHRVITIAAAAANWHAALLGQTNMRPGIEPPAATPAPHSTDSDMPPLPTISRTDI
jgi:hypothetical protein